MARWGFLPRTPKAVLQTIQAVAQLFRARAEHAHAHAELARLEQPQHATHDGNGHDFVLNPLEGVRHEDLEAADTGLAVALLAVGEVGDARLVHRVARRAGDDELLPLVALLLGRRARIALGTATQCTRRNDSP
jgi:hypothetical protein